MRNLFWILIVLLYAGCGGGGGGAPGSSGSTSSPGNGDCAAPCSTKISWLGNPETAVNSAGGGYRVYYPGAAGGSSPVLDVPYVSGPAAPTSVTLNLESAGTYYVRVVAYSSINTAGSEASAETTITVYNP
ncbi:MAG: hypothetical protein HS115_05040 [Spirochaetales bacterium]|nr:hypothetical protein [Spirochaetales bacterium]